MQFEPWHYWLLGTLFFLFWEIIIPSFVMLSISIGCSFAFATSLFNAPLVVQLIMLIIGIIVGFVGVKPFMEHYVWTRQKQVRTNYQGMIGKVGRVCDNISTDADYGHVILDGDTWQAISADGSDIKIGTKVEVVDIDSIVLTVKSLVPHFEDNSVESITQMCDNSLENEEEVPVTLHQQLAVTVGNKKQIYSTDEVLCFYSLEKISYMLLNNGKTMIIDDSLDRLQQKINSKQFFRANRQFYLSMKCVRQISSGKNGKLEVRLCDSAQLPSAIVVSRLKAHAFRQWLQGQCAVH